MQVEAATLWVIGGMALVTYATRAGGLWLMGRIALSPWVEAWLRHIPGAVLVAIIAPAAVGSGPAEALATLMTVMVAARTKNLLLAIVAGAGVVAILRAII